MTITLFYTSYDSSIFIQCDNYHHVIFPSLQGSVLITIRLVFLAVRCSRHRPLQKRERTEKEYGYFRLFEKLMCSNERSTKFESLYHR